MRRYFFLLISLCVILQYGYSKPRTYTEVVALANTFYKKTPAVKSVSSNSIKLAYSGYSESVLTRSESTPSFYVFNVGDKNGFIIVSGDDRATEILGYSTSGSFSVDSIPTNFKNWLEVYKKEASILANTTSNSTTVAKSSTNSGFATAVSPLLGSTKWDQSSPYNLFCPKSGTKPTYTGCVATAMAQIIRYHQYPIHGTGTKTYTSKTLKKQLTVSFTDSTFDWSNMQNTYSGTESYIQKKAVASLMFCCGVAANMDYSTTGSSAYDESMAIGLIKYFGYDSNLRTLYKDYYTNDEWETLLKTELNNNRPVLYGGGNKDNEGHAFVCDGYDSNGLYHFNWGWSGSCDGYYVLTSLNPNSSGYDAASSSSGYTVDQDMTIGIQKPSADSNPSYQLLLNDQTNMTLTTKIISSISTFSMTVPFYNGGITFFSGKTAVGLYKDSDLLASLGETNNIALSGFNSGNFDDTTVAYTDVSLPSNLSDGVYQLYSIYKGSDESSWSKMRGLTSQTTFFNIQLQNGIATLKDSSATAINNSTELNAMCIYPGVVNDVLFLNSTDVVKAITIFNISGQGISSVKPLSDGEISIPVSNLATGTYIIKCETSSVTKVFRFIKK